MSPAAGPHWRTMIHEQHPRQSVPVVPAHWEPEWNHNGTRNFIGVVVYGIAFRILTTRRKPFLASRWTLPNRRDIDTQLVIGALIFGAGWGLGGYCPGPALTDLAFGRRKPLYIEH